MLSVNRQTGREMGEVCNYSLSTMSPCSPRANSIVGHSGFAHEAAVRYQTAGAGRSSPDAGRVCPLGGMVAMADERGHSPTARARGAALVERVD